MLKKFVTGEFNSYEDFLQNFEIRVPENFNYAFNVVDSDPHRQEPAGGYLRRLLPG